jgi:hypothetical protein
MIWWKVWMIGSLVKSSLAHNPLLHDLSSCFDLPLLVVVVAAAAVAVYTERKASVLAIVMHQALMERGSVVAVFEGLHLVLLGVCIVHYF